MNTCLSRVSVSVGGKEVGTENPPADQFTQPQDPYYNSFFSIDVAVDTVVNYG